MNSLAVNGLKLMRQKVPDFNICNGIVYKVQIAQSLEETGRIMGLKMTNKRKKHYAIRWSASILCVRRRRLLNCDPSISFLIVTFFLLSSTESSLSFDRITRIGM